MTISERVDAAYVNVGVALFHLRDVFKQPGALVFDQSLPYLKASFFLSTIKHPEIIDRFNKFQKENASAIATLKNKYQLENDLEGLATP